MTTFGDLIFWGCVALALWYVPRYLWRVYGGANAVKRLWSVVPSVRGSDYDNAGADTSSARAVPPQQHQSASELVLDFDSVLDYLRRHKLTDEQAIDLLTLATREEGDLLSANKIRDIVGGNEAAVKARVASHRPKAPARPSSRLERPANGWGKAS